MSGHLLSSINAEAAAAIQPAPARPKLPGVGELVVYHMRAGYARSGRTTFPAIVQGHGDRETLMLTVIIDAQDWPMSRWLKRSGSGASSMSGRRRIRIHPELIAQWRLEMAQALKQVQEVQASMASLRDEVAHALKVAMNGRAEVKSLEMAVFGEFNKPDISLTSILVDFEKRLAALKESQT